MAKSDIVMMDALALSRAIKSKQASCVEVMNATLDHIERLNPHVNAIVSLQDRGALLKQSQERDAQLARDEYCGWMHGFPLAVKDLIATKGIRTTQGSPIFKDFVPAADAIVVERMKRAGGIVIGKTNTPEFGLGSNTYNDVFGRTLNAYDQSKTSGGSSGGAGVAVALRMLPVADGSDHGGSLRNPAAWNNVFGFRPSYGRVPAQGLDVFYAYMGVQGPMARNVPDLAMLLSVQAGYDPRLPLSNRQDPAQFAGDLPTRSQGRAYRLVRRFRRRDPVRTGRARSLQIRAQDVRGVGMHRRRGDARLPDRDRSGRTGAHCAPGKPASRSRTSTAIRPSAR